MDIIIKRQQIEANKVALESMIKIANENLNKDLNIITQVLDKHSDFLSFIEIMKIYEFYKWTDIKKSYIEIKKQITKDSKLFLSIVRLYGNIISYYPEIIINKMNSTIKNIKNDHDSVLLNFNLLRKKHKETTKKCVRYIKSNETTKIYDISPEITPLITKLYKNYIDIKMINKQSNYLRTKKMNLLSQINQIQHQITTKKK